MCVFERAYEYYVCIRESISQELEYKHTAFTRKLKIPIIVYGIVCVKLRAIGRDVDLNFLRRL